MANFVTRTYDPGQVNLSIGGRDISGYADGQFIKVSRLADQANLVVGSDGESTLALSMNRAGSLELILQQSSPLNDYLSSLADALENRDMSNAVVPFMVKDSNGTSLSSAKQCWVKKRADVSYAKDPENRTWVFETGNLAHFVGGEVELGS